MYIELTEEQINAVLAEKGTISAAMLRRIIAPVIEFLQSAGGKETLTSLLSYDHILEGIIPEWVAFKKAQAAAPAISTGPGWITWAGGERPLAPDTQVCIRLRDGNEAMSPAGIWRWTHVNAESDIVAYRIIEAAEPEWIEWAGGTCPVDAGTKVRVRFPDGFVSSTRVAESLAWQHHGRETDIVAYRVIEA